VTDIASDTEIETLPICPPGARLIELRRTTGPSLFAIVDEADYDDLARFNWHAWFGQREGNGPYAIRNTRRSDGVWTAERMQRRILPGAECVDHVDGNGLDNRRANLRTTTNAENGRNRRGVQANNSSGFLGVTWDRRDAKWRAQVSLPRVDGRERRKLVGLFASPVAAAIARDLAALEIDAEHYTLNFPGLRNPLPIVPLTA
jgi:hypothetical protein